jgi:hypothetical protein
MEGMKCFFYEPKKSFRDLTRISDILEVERKIFKSKALSAVNQQWKLFVKLRMT